MPVGAEFKTFCARLQVHDLDALSSKYALITRRLNLAFWGHDSPTGHSMYTGSFGRGTATGYTSDVDVLFALPKRMHAQYNAYSSNGQSALLQAVRTTLYATYPSSQIGADRQVVVIDFSDGTRFEILPAFRKKNGSFLYGDAKDSGSWKATNPTPEIDAVEDLDEFCNGNLRHLCQMMRAWKDEWNVPISGLLLDTLGYQFLSGWKPCDEDYSYYDWMCRDFFAYLASRDEGQAYWLAPGSRQHVPRTGSFMHAAQQSLRLANDAEVAADLYDGSEALLWRDVFGAEFP